MASPELSKALKNMVIRECHVQDITAEQIGDELPVIGGEDVIRLDSLDAVEIVTSIERNFGLKADSMGPMKNIFKSFSHFADYVEQNTPKDKIETFLKRYQLPLSDHAAQNDA